jgi:hypothetical protein
MTNAAWTRGWGEISITGSKRLVAAIQYALDHGRKRLLAQNSEVY